MAERLKHIMDQEIRVADGSVELLRAKKRMKSKTEHLVFIKHLPQHRVTVRNCKNHQAVIEADTLIMSCQSVLGTDRQWVFLLDKFFKAGSIKLELTEKWFNLMMINLDPGPLEVQAKRIILNRKTSIRFLEKNFEEVVTWTQKDD